MKYLRWLLFPFSLMYGLVVIVRNWCFDAGIFKSQKFGKPVIAVGNLEVGGAGKSPMTEYLVRLLKDEYKVATLSRGYGRETSGYIVAGVTPFTSNNTTLAGQIGDEPAQFKNKFPDITVAVCEKRVGGINQLLPNHGLVLLDDAYQHRAVEPGLSILLSDYNKINEPHLLLPAGNFREPFSGRWRAQVIIVTKCPETLSLAEKEQLAQKIEPLPYQSLYFTSINYQPLTMLNNDAANDKIERDTSIFLLTGIANSKPLLQHLSGYTANIIHHNYPDHHPFTLENITKLAGEFAADPSPNKLVITTEKDAQRLDGSWLKAATNGIIDLPVRVIPIQVAFLDNSGPQFNQLIIDYVRKHTA